VENLETPDHHHLNAAAGWFELGNHAEARLELARISREQQSHPAVLDLRWSLCAAAMQWEEAYAVAQQLISVAGEHPGGWLHAAYSLRRKPGGGLAAAMEFLLPVVDRFPDEPILPFNLACYACQLGQMGAAREWLNRAAIVGGRKKIQTLARTDEDLRPLWPELDPPASSART
jgi:tetratricopeptide (TPR) repeat protein